MGKPKLKVVADRGYFSSPDIRACHLNNISAYAVPLNGRSGPRSTNGIFLPSAVEPNPIERTSLRRTDYAVVTICF